MSTPEGSSRAATLSAVTKGEYPYPPDEFDDVDASDGPRGVHRRPRGWWATSWPYLAALVVSAALAYVVIGLLWDERRAAPLAGASEPAAIAESSPPAAEQPPTEPAAPADGEAPADPGTTADPTAGVEPPAAVPNAAPTPVPTADLATPVTVLNATGVAGLAAATADRLEDAGWTRVGSGNFTGGTLPGSTVRYPTADLEASARAVATELGITAVELAGPDAVDGIQVVLEGDFADLAG